MYEGYLHSFFYNFISRSFNDHDVAIKRYFLESEDKAGEVVDEEDTFQPIKNAVVHNELSILSKVKGEGIVMAYGYSIHEGYHHIVMEKGERIVMENLEEVDYEKKKSYICQIVRGLLTLWEKGICYGDLKLDNIMLVNGECKLNDFGISKMITGGFRSDM